MEQSNTTDFLQAFVNFRKMGIPSSPGFFSDEYIALENRPELREGIFFTKLQMHNAINNGGILLLHQNNKEGLVELEFLNRGIYFTQVTENIIRVKLDLDGLIDHYEFIHDLTERLRLNYTFNE